MKFSKSAVGAILAALPNSALAHLVSNRFGEFYGGFLHPLSTLSHFVPWLALGLLGGLQGPKVARWALLAFPVSVFAGALANASNPEWQWVSGLNLLSFVVLGLLVLLSLRLGIRGYIALVVIFGLSHGYANGTVELAGGERLLYIAGVATAAYVLIALVTATAQSLAHAQRWSNIAVRAAGSWVIAIGIVFGGYKLLAP